MNLKFDKHTLQSFHDQGITDIHVYTRKVGCAGLKVFFEPMNEEKNLTGNCFLVTGNGGLNLYVTKEDAQLLNGGQIAVANGKTYFSSPKIKGRCGCGTSISFTEKKIDLSMSKIHRLSEKLGNIPEIKKALKK